MVSQIVQYYDEIFDIYYDFPIEDASSFYQRCLSTILYEKGKKRNMINEMEHLYSKVMKQKETLYEKPLKQDDCYFLDYQCISTDIMDFINELNFCKLDLENCGPVWDPETEMGINVFTSNIENCHSNDFVETDYEYLFSSFYTNDLNDQCVSQNLQLNGENSIRGQQINEIQPFETFNFPPDESNTLDPFLHEILYANTETCITSPLQSQNLQSVGAITGDLVSINELSNGTKSTSKCNRWDEESAKKHSTPVQNCDTRALSSNNGTKMRRLPQVENKYQCNNCHKIFPSNYRLSNHLRIHRKRQFQCKICDETFVQKTHLDDHQSFHSGDRPYTCKVCGNTFTRKSSLTRHEKMKHDSEPVNAYSETFVRKHNLTNHRTIRDNKRPFFCATCEKGFTSKRYLRIHITKVHIKNRKCFKCSICKKSFLNKNLFSTHTISHNKNT